MAQSTSRQRVWTIGFLAGAAALLALGFAARKYVWPAAARNQLSEKGLESSRKIRRSPADVLELSEQTYDIMNLRISRATAPRYLKMLKLRGSLQIDPNRQIPVHARFPGHIVELATISGLRSQSADPSSTGAHPLQTFDSVVKGAPLAVIWSKDLGEKKSQLADAMAKLRLDTQTLENFKKLTQSGSISDRDYREQRAKVEQGEIATFTAEATLRSYQVSEEDIESVKAASEMIHQRKKTDQHFAADWARVIVSAPISGVIVDKTVTVGQIVDVNDNLFKIADLTVVAIYLHAYEEDLSSIEEMSFPLSVDLKVPANPEIGILQGRIERIGPIIDPNEHMALLIGTVKNPDGLLRVGQFITGDVGIPAKPGIVEIPSNALIDVGNDAVVYLQSDRSKLRFERRRVVVVQRHFDSVQLRSELTDEQKELGLSEIHPNDPVISGGVLELEDYQSQQSSPADETQRGSKPET